ncbi:hypothetical protein [Nocardia salmonicida]|uniref:hypothetical protein n=1 Tax=Nocardia salmonicida TaxID=53431 RepID=UPI0033CC3CE3
MQEEHILHAAAQGVGIAETQARLGTTDAGQIVDLFGQPRVSTVTPSRFRVTTSRQIDTSRDSRRIGRQHFLTF